MKALFSRLNRSGKDAKEKEKIRDREKVYADPPVFRDNTPVNRIASTVPPSLNKPLPSLQPQPQPQPRPPPDVDPESSAGRASMTPTPANTAESHAHTTESHTRSVRSKQSGGHTSADVPPKKVAFISPPPTPGGFPSQTLEPEEQQPPPPPVEHPPEPRPSHAKGPISRIVADTRQYSPNNNAEPSASTTPRPTQTPTPRTAASPTQSARATPYQEAASMRSGSPFSFQSGRSAIQAVASWSEGAEEDLVCNLGPRERTRQEVLWEIVASEERYVAELLKMKETFLEPLLHPYAATASPTQDQYDDHYYGDLAMESSDNLPIAARFLSPTPVQEAPSNSGHSASKTLVGTAGPPTIHPSDGESYQEDERKRMGKAFAPSSNSKAQQYKSPYGASFRTKKSESAGQLPFPSRSHQSLPPPPRAGMQASATSLARQSMVGEGANPPPSGDRRMTATPASRVLQKLHRKPTVAVLGAGVAPHTLPEDLRLCLETLDRCIIKGHLTLGEALRKRYEEQYPLVRSLADVFVANSHILRDYATYVLHLGRALDQVEDCLTADVSKRPRKQDLAEWLKVSKVLQRLEETAADKGETGLAISLSKPFQRLLKYPLLFQNLLFHTDPSTFEYESTLLMVAEVETIVRSIEDEKIQKEERDKTRDVFGRIEGLDKDKKLALPKATRVLVDERPLDETPAEPSKPPVAPMRSPSPRVIRQKGSLKRFSDSLQPGSSSGVGSKKDLWLVTFNDVVLRCQRTGVTTLPAGSQGTGRTNSLPEMKGRAKYYNSNRRSVHTKPRNLYKFIKIETWIIGEVAKPRAGVVSMEDVNRTHARVAAGGPKSELSDPTEDGNDSDSSDRKSKMSFSYWGGDKVVLQTPVPSRPGKGTAPGGRRPNAVPTGYQRESTANAKFGQRLRSPELVEPANRPASRRTLAPGSGPGPGPQARRPSAQSEDTLPRGTKPAWDKPQSPNTTRIIATPTPGPPRRAHATSASSSQAPRMSKAASPAPSEDSGVGFYRRVIAQDPSL
ncbi:hypothetical protein BOTBODRAFT_171718 [Botryobasidium botryosum FD-172 SS1]|uniref:DH domain-containing protein n=1 Tax=Botryobasidium botryosum (strain FD-172 SS1) TaxID=930990 RepID=A0A067MQJ8_BOTB1|nr:hypothetical protein BOTBODRAFT_171718 [Botryobasidium botryosum FD-172 SS1]